MALFKILKGKSANLPANKVNGYCYVTTDEHKLYVDYTKDDGTLDRFALNAETATKLTTASAGSTTQPVYFTGGKPAPISYTIAKSVPSNAVFTDVNVTQTAVTASDYTNWRSLIFGQGNNASEGFSPANATGVVYATNTLSCQPSTGTIRANVYKFGSNAKIEYDSTNECLNFVFS